MDHCTDEDLMGIAEFNGETKHELIANGEYETFENDLDVGIKVSNYGKGGNDQKAKRNLLSKDGVTETQNIKGDTVGSSKSIAEIDGDEVTQIRRVFTLGKDIKPHITTDDTMGSQWKTIGLAILGSTR